MFLICNLIDSLGFVPSLCSRMQKFKIKDVQTELELVNLIKNTKNFLTSLPRSLFEVAFFFRVGKI